MLRILLALLVTAGLHAEATKQYVTLDGARLLSKPQAFSTSYGTLKRGQTVYAEKAKGGYLKVLVIALEGQKLRKTEGYLQKQAIQKNRPRLTSKYTQSKDASAEEVAAATKGFNKQVEAQYKKDNAALDYDQVTKLEERTLIPDPQTSLKEFRKKGKLGEYSASNKDSKDSAEEGDHE